MSKTALIIIDMQNDLAHPEGSLFVPDAAHRADVMEGLQRRFRDEGAPVIQVIRSHRADGWDAELSRVPMFVEGNGLAVQDSWGMSPIDRLYPERDEPVVLKRRFSGFLGTELDLLLRRANIERLVLAGVSLHASVRATAVDAVCYDYETVLAEDAIATAIPDTRQANFIDLRTLGCRVAPADEIVKELSRASERV
ncbi:MAG: cysteine hydrolase family protein [Actinomycetota bacterium]